MRIHVRESFLAVAWITAVALSQFHGPAFAKPPAPQPSTQPQVEYRDEIQRDFKLRSRGHLQITNMRGDIVIQGWSQDRIHVKARRRAIAGSREGADRLFSAVDFRFKASDGQIELSAEYGRGLTLQERLRERENPRTGMEIIVYAPARLRLRAWGVDGKITIKDWNAPVDARASSGEIRIEDVRSGGASVLCPACSIQLSAIRGPVRCMGGTGAMSIHDIESSQTYIEADGGTVTANKVRGEQLYVTKLGALNARELHGRIEFHGQTGSVEIVESTGFVSGRTTSGNIVLRMREWEFADKAVIESIAGSVQLSLPSRFSGDVDLFSRSGRVEIGFPVEPLDEQLAKPVAPDKRRISGRVGEGGELLKILSSQGNIQVIKGG